MSLLSSESGQILHINSIFICYILSDFYAMHGMAFVLKGEDENRNNKLMLKL